MERLLLYVYEYFPYVLALLLSFPVHEFAHGFIADKLGDPTARREGRLTLNPFAHLDLWGSISMLVCGYGWAKPVPVNPFNLRDRKGGMALVAIAGPVSNLIMMLIAAVVAKLLLAISGMSAWILFLYRVFWELARVNLRLAVFNLLPVPPLDGSKVLYYFLPNRIAVRIQQKEHIIYMVFMGLLVLEGTGVLTFGIGSLLSIVTAPVWFGLCMLFGLPL